MQNRYRGNAVLIELLIVILFFALCAVIAMGLFVTAQERSRESEQIADALIAAQNVAESLYGRADMRAWLLEAGFSESNGAYARALSDRLTVRVEADADARDAGTLHSAQVTALDGDRTILSLPVAYYRSGEATS